MLDAPRIARVEPGRVTLVRAGQVGSRFEVKTADATISVDPEHSYLVEARIIDGRKYLLIPADEDIEVNGFGVRVKGE